MLNANNNKFLISLFFFIFFQLQSHANTLNIYQINNLYNEKNYNLCTLEAQRFLFFSNSKTSSNDKYQVNHILFKTYLKQYEEKKAIKLYKKLILKTSPDKKINFWQDLYFYSLQQFNFPTAKYFLTKLETSSISTLALNQEKKNIILLEKMRLNRLQGNYLTARKINYFLPENLKWKPNFLKKEKEMNLSGVVISSILFPGGGHYYHGEYKNGILSSFTVLGLSSISYYFLKEKKLVLGLFSAYFAFIYYQNSIFLAIRREYLLSEKKRKELQQKIILSSKYKF